MAAKRTMEDIPNDIDQLVSPHNLKYMKVPGSHIKGDPQKMGESLEPLKVQYGQQVPPAELVKVARDPAHPCHKDFTWNNTKAANAWRLDQARYILRSVVVETIISGVRTYRPNFVVLRYGNELTQPYNDFIDAMTDPRKRAKVLDVALQELQALERKYAKLHELNIIFSALHSVLARHARAKKKAKKLPPKPPARPKLPPKKKKP